MTTEAQKRTQRRKDHRPGEILAAGMAEFAEHGLERARLDRIARRAGIAKGTIYLYFPSKEALFEAAVKEHVVKMLDATMADVVQFEGPTKQLLILFLRRLYQRFTSEDQIAIMRILVAEGRRFPELTERYHELAISRGIEVLAKLMERGVARGELRDCAVSNCPQVLISPAMFYGMHGAIFGEKHPMDLEAYLEAHVELALHGILVR